MHRYRALILRGNRFLGASLVNKKLVTSADLDAANEKFMQAVQASDQLKGASILLTLLHETKTLDEAKYMELLVEEYKLGLIDLNFFELSSLRSMDVEIDMDLCRSTYTLPFDKVDNTYLLASCYYISAPVVKHWEELLNGNVIWYGITMQSFTRAIEKIDDIHTAEDEAEELEDEDD